jgi:hydrogenase-4 component E
VSRALVDAVLVLGLAVVVVRRRSTAIAILGAQSLALGIAALSLGDGRAGSDVVAGVVLLSKAVVLPLLLYALMRATREARPVLAANAPLTRLAGAGAVALCAAWLTPRLGVGSASTERAALAVVLIGITIVVTRRPILFQLIGLIVAENGVALLAVSVPGGLSYVVDLGALFDLAVVVAVAAAFATRIHTELGTGDTELLRGLRD